MNGQPTVFKTKRFLIVMVGSDPAHEFVTAYDELETARTQATERNARAGELGIAARYAVRDSQAATAAE